MLQAYCRRHQSIRHCFIRHSTALGAQNPLLSDFDVIFFVEARNFDVLQAPARRFRDDIQKLRIVSCIVLPATAAAYQLCSTHYPFRSMYPMQNWLCLYGDAPEGCAAPLSASSATTLPLDHAPEAFLFSYAVPVLQRKKRSHMLEGALMRRKLNMDSLRIAGQPTAAPARRFHDIVAGEVRLWDQFYGRIRFPAGKHALSVRIPRQSFEDPFMARWARLQSRQSSFSGLASIWLYPCFFDGRAPYLAVNLNPAVTGDECRNITAAILACFEGLSFRLQIGTERSMHSRLSGLSRVSLIDPWLFRSAGVCLTGNSGLREEVNEPCLEHLREKLQEYLLYVSYRIFCLRPYPYWLYSLAFTLDQLFRRRELLLDTNEIADIYGKAFLPQSRLQGQDGRERFLDPWKQFHGFDLFAQSPG